MEEKTAVLIDSKLFHGVTFGLFIKSWARFPISRSAVAASRWWIWQETRRKCEWFVISWWNVRHFEINSLTTGGVCITQAETLSPPSIWTAITLYCVQLPIVQCSMNVLTCIFCIWNYTADHIWFTSAHDWLNTVLSSGISCCATSLVPEMYAYASRFDTFITSILSMHIFIRELVNYFYRTARQQQVKHHFFIAYINILGTQRVLLHLAAPFPASRTFLLPSIYCILHTHAVRYITVPKFCACDAWEPVINVNQFTNTAASFHLADLLPPKYAQFVNSFH